MNEENINITSIFSKVLVAPLDWGLGHATRCIPIIHALLKQNVTVILAASGATKKLLQKEFPQLTILPLRGYNITYGQTKSSFNFKMFTQIPKILSVISYEKKWLKYVIAAEKIDAVISDNRFGLSNKHIKSIFITHQLAIETGSTFFNQLVKKINYAYINTYSECWVPDVNSHHNLAGTLAHPAKMPAVQVKYLGILSRFEKINTDVKNDLLLLISGPEPQRTIFEALLLNQLKHTVLNVVCVRGLPEEENDFTSSNKNIRFINHAPADELNRLIQQSAMVVSRCGYSTVMDLATLQKKAILVPTPGQQEQEYLAKYLMDKGLFFSASQENFNLENALQLAKDFSFKTIEPTSNLLQQTIEVFTQSLKTKALQ